ncbi:MAG: outer membrane beta-barrel protein [Colwellia sp.]
MRVILVLACALTITSLQSSAKKPLNLEITPLIGYRFGGDFETSKDETHNRIELSEEVSYGFITAWSFDKKRQGEFVISHYNTHFSHSDDFSASNTSLSITYAHLGGAVPVAEGALPLYVTGGFGLTHIAPSEDELANETRFSMNVGLASKIPLTDHISLRLDSRIYATFFNSDSAIFCDIETCAVYISSDMWLQSEVSAGITYKF